MKIAVAGAAGKLGRLIVASLTSSRHDVVRIDRAHGIDLLSGDGLDTALTRVAAVIDVINARIRGRGETEEFFSRTTSNLLAAEARAGVGHHVLLTVAGIHKVVGPAHYAGKKIQERLVAEGPVPWTIQPATQFHDFAVTLADNAEHHGISVIPPLLLQPVAPTDVADLIAARAAGDPAGWVAPIAGPHPHDLIDMARRTHQAQGREVTLVPSWDGPFGPDMAGPVLLAGPEATIAHTTFEDWLSTVSPAPVNEGHMIRTQVRST